VAKIGAFFVDLHLLCTYGIPALSRVILKMLIFMLFAAVTWW